jgi:hypothetical protein
MVSTRSGVGLAARAILVSIRPTNCMPTLMILAKSRLCDSARPVICREPTPMAIKISAFFAAFAILLLPAVSCGGCPAKPSIASISPNTAAAGGAGFTLTVNGGNFNSNSVVVWNGSTLTTSLVNGNQLTATVSSTQIAQPDTASVYVYNNLSGTLTIGSGAAEATNSNGCSPPGSNEVSFTVSP